MSRYRILITAGVLALLAGIAPAQTETINMSVLNSRRHRIGVTDNPMVGFFTSADQGRTWEHHGWKEYIRTFYTETDPDGVIWSACGNGVLRSTDRGATWRVTTGWDVTEVLKVKVNPAHPGEVAASTAYGVIITTDGGERWRTTSTGIKRFFSSDLTWMPGARGGLLAATEDGLYRSLDRGASWKASGLRGRGIRVVLADRRNPKKYWAGTEDDGVYVSTDGGVSWHARSAGLTHRTVYALALDPSDTAIVYAGTFGGGVYKTIDAGVTWRQCMRGLTNPDVHALVVLSSNPSTVFAGTLNGGLFKSTDAGQSWEFNSQEDAQVWGLSVGGAK